MPSKHVGLLVSLCRDDSVFVAVAVCFVVGVTSVVPNAFQFKSSLSFSYSSARDTKTLKGTAVGSTKTSVTVTISCVAEITVVVVTVVGSASHAFIVEHLETVVVEYSDLPVVNSILLTVSVQRVTISDSQFDDLLEVDVVELGEDVIVDTLADAEDVTVLVGSAVNSTN